MVPSGPPGLWAALRYDDAYIEGMRRASGWMFERVRATCPLPAPDDGWDAWIEAVRSESGKCKGWIMAIENCHVARKAAAELGIREVWVS